MNLRRLLTGTGVGLAAIAIALSQSLPAGAAPTQATGQALEIGPPVLSLSGDPGATLKADLKLRNVSSSSMVITSEINDFTANKSSESGDPKIVLDSTEPNPYSMISWVKPLSQLTLKSRQMVTVPVSITIPKNAAPGGYYAAVRFTGRPADLSSTGVSLSASIASLVLMKVNGAAKESMSVEEFSVRQDSLTGGIFESTPIQFTERLKNSGNLHEQPTGYVTIKDMFGKTVTNLSINADQRNVLPQSIRKFEQSLDSQAIGTRILFGHYTADMSVTYGANKTVLTKQLGFWIIPYRIIGLAIAALVGTFFLFRFLIRRYNRAIISKAQGGTSSQKPPKTPKK